MRIQLSQGRVKFDLVDKTGTIHGSQEFETSGELECGDIPLDGMIGNQPIELVPKITDLKCKGFWVDGKSYSDAIAMRANKIGYDRNAGPLYP